MAETRLDWRQLISEALTAPGNLYDTYSRFHDYSLGNMMLFRQQGLFEPVASYNTWKRLGRQVTRGARASEVIVPVMVTEEVETLEQQRERVARLIGFKVVPAVFGYSQTSGPEIAPKPTPGWDLQTALDKLGIREREFDQTNGNMAGYSIGVEYAINPVAPNPTKTRYHEIAHILLGHTIGHGLEGESYHRGVQEFQAETAAYLVMNELGVLDERTAEISRGYINHWLGDERPPDKAFQQVFTAADRIFRAGRDAH
jgi:hypothetical protein